MGKSFVIHLQSVSAKIFCRLLIKFPFLGVKQIFHTSYIRVIKFSCFNKCLIQKQMLTVLTKEKYI